jgi:DNA-binding beta-propeller fold protein YncE/predicted anti-sigma-YlaC factor YlaD
MVHVRAEELSALLDGELSAQAELRARQHLTECASCSAEYALSVRLDEELRQPPALACNQVLEVLSAGLDRETGEGEQAAAQRHLADCQDCRASLATWSGLATAIKALPIIAPSVRIDDAIYAIARSRRTYRPALVRGIAARALIAVTAVFAVIAASLTAGGPPQTATLPNPTTERAAVASIQQIVFNSRNNTVYVLDALGAAVDARDPATNDLKTHIQVGGEPTALALNEVANRVLVLDSSLKRVTEIDAASNTVVGATAVAVTGTPTSISVDPATNNIVVTTTTKSPAPGTSAGSVAVINSTTKQLETVREFSVAPRLVVPDQQGRRSALVTADQTQLVDSGYKILEILPGGVSAAFSKQSDNLAVLSPSGSDSVITFSGFIAPQALKLAGAPRALTALPDGGYLVLVDLGGRGRVSKITREGAVFASVEVAVTTGDLIYDEATNRFTVANNGRLDTAQMPEQVATVPTASTTPSGPASASPSASPSATPAATPASATQTAPAVATIGPNVLAAAGQLTPGNVYNLPLNGIKPQFVAASGSRLWLLDQSNNVSSFDMITGDLFDIGPLRKGAKVSYWVAGGSYVYGVDASSGEVNIVDAARDRVVGGFATNVLSAVSAVAVGIDGRLWIGLRDASYLFVFDPRTQLMNSVDLAGARISALTIDGQGRIYYADDARGTVGTFDPRTSKVNEVPFARRGATTALLVDSTSTLWVGTSTGEIYSVRGSKGTLTISLQRPVTAFAPDQGGRAWYLAQLPTGLSGYAFGPADGSKAPRSISGPAQTLNFNAIGRAFLADPRGGFYMSIEGGR